MTAKLTDEYRVYTLLDSHPLKDGWHFANIRIADRKDRNKAYDFPVFLPNGERLKLKKGQVVEGTVAKGLPESQRNDLNHYLEGIEFRIKDYVLKTPIYSKDALKDHIYSKAFLNLHEKKRTRELKLEIKEAVPTSLHKALRQEYPKKREVLEITTIDNEGFEVTEEQKVVIDPLSMEDFPKNFPKELYERFKKEALVTVNDKQKKEYLKKDEKSKWFLDQFIKFHIERTNTFFTQKTKEVVTVGKEVLRQFEKENPTGDSLKIVSTPAGQSGYINTTERLLELKSIRDISNMTTEQIYKKDLWNHNDIFEMFASTYFDDTTNDTYTKIVVRLYEYYERCKPERHIKYFNVQWLIDFFNYLKKEGWYHINTKSFDPLNYDPAIFFQDKPRSEYKVKSLNRMISLVKTLCIGDKSEKTIPFYKKGWIPKLDLSDLKKGKESKGTRIEHNITKDELDKLFWFQFDKKNLGKYQTIFNKVNKSKKIVLTMTELETARKLFILQVCFGGLRGYKELATAKLIKLDKEHIVTFYQNKVENTVTNPLNDYTERILKPLNYQIPVLEKINTHNPKLKVSNINAMEQHYLSILRTIGKIIEFDREILTDAKKFIHKPVQEIFSPYFARKTWGQICWDDLRLREPEIALFTGHVDETEGELGQSYINKKSIRKKKELIAKLKVGKNPY